MKKILIIMALMAKAFFTMACATCELSQPKYLRGITHGSGPDSKWDIVIVSIIAIIVLITLFFSIKWIVNPGETSVNHIKNRILKIDYNER